MNNILEKVNNLDKNLYEYRKNIRPIAISSTILKLMEKNIIK